MKIADIKDVATRKHVSELVMNAGQIAATFVEKYNYSGLTTFPMDIVALAEELEEQWRAFVKEHRDAVPKAFPEFTEEFIAVKIAETKLGQ